MSGDESSDKEIEVPEGEEEVGFKNVGPLFEHNKFKFLRRDTVGASEAFQNVGIKLTRIVRHVDEEIIDDDDEEDEEINARSANTVGNVRVSSHFVISGADIKHKVDDNRIYKFGEKGSGLTAKGDAQDFNEIRDYHYNNGTLFEDPQFPCNDKSLYYSSDRPRHHYRYDWLRPGEICNDPKLFVEGYSRFDVQQGELGDCWLLAAIANITMYHNLFFQVVPMDQSFDEKYAGMFHFRFWQYGKWIDVVVDDRLPTVNGELVFMRSTEQNEFWSALLEKAYAKLHGSYESLKGGSTCEALEDFTGGVSEMYELQESPPDLFKILKNAFERGSLMGCSIEPDPNELEAQTSQGLVKGHAYSLTKVAYVQVHTSRAQGKIPLIRIRNPWGNEAEWNGPWSDESPEWSLISPDEKETMGLNFDSDGEFWMSFQDFKRYFDRVEICNLSPDSLADEEGNKKWSLSTYEGAWVKGVTAGGCRNFIDTFANNPQYRVTLTEPDEDDDEGKCTIILSLMQKNRRQQRDMGLDVLTIGFAMYYLPDPDRAPKPLDRSFFRHNQMIGKSPTFINLREVSCRFRLPLGTYCIVPSTFEADEEGEFLIRIFSEHKNEMEENDQVIGMTGKISEDEDEHTSPFQIDNLEAKFHEISAGHEEIGWIKLKQLLDFALEAEFKVEIKRDKIGNSQSTPHQTEVNQNNLLTTILSLLCGAVCKDTPLADFIPKSEESPLLSMSKQPEYLDKGFSPDVCRTLVALMDSNRSGRLSFEEVKVLLSDIRQWMAVFKRFDKDESNNLSGYELRNAMNSAGFTLNNRTLNMIMHRYGNENASIEFDDFFMCVIRLKHMIEAFNEKDEEKTHEATFNLNEWVDLTIYS